MLSRIERVVVVGGGTAGWLSAMYLLRSLRNEAQITVVESPSIPRVGVGEATIPTLGATMRFLGFQDEEWMPQVGATYKAAIRFIDWTHIGQSTRSDYWHPFISRPEPAVLPYDAPFFPEIGRGISLLHYALKRRLDGGEAIAKQLNPLPELCLAGRSPRDPGRSELSLPSAYHIDAHRLGDFLQSEGKKRGVEQIVAHVSDVVLDDRGFIEKLVTSDGQQVHGDLFVDCTGFRGLLINGALKERFLPDSDSLLCDAAVAIPCEAPPSGPIPPFSTATALKHGWMWHIPLFARHGCGYVYSSSTCTKEEAEHELRAHLPAKPIVEDALHIRMRVGRCENLWAKNCVAVGLSGCFIEPLESTGIFLIEYGLAALVSLFPSKSFEPAKAHAYNRTMADMYDEIRDFVVLHYALSRRTDTTFWRAVQHEMAVPDSLKEKMEFFRSSLPVLDELKLQIFRAYNYTCILDGNNALPQGELPLLRHIGYERGFEELDRIRARTGSLLTTMRDHRAVIEQMRAGSS